MTLGKSLLLGSAAAVVLGSGAQAADLPVRKAAPVDYVRVCDWTGVGYFYIPGTDTCLKIEGLIRVEGVFVNNARQFFPTTSVGSATRLVAAGTVIPGRQRRHVGLLRSRPSRRRRPHADRLRHPAHLRPLPDRPSPGHLCRRRFGWWSEHLRQPGRQLGLPRQGLHPVRRHHGRSRAVLLRLLRRQLQLRRYRQLRYLEQRLRLHLHRRWRLLGHLRGRRPQRS